MFWLGPKLGHGEEVMLFDVLIDMLSNNLLKEFPNALYESYGLVTFRNAVVRFLGFVNNNNGCMFPWMNPIS